MAESRLQGELPVPITDGEYAEERAALVYILEAWAEALHDGLNSDHLANATLFAAFSGLIASYGEDAVAAMAEGLACRIERGDFTLNRTLQ